MVPRDEIGTPGHDTESVLDRITDRYAERYDGIVDREEIDRQVHESYETLKVDAVTDTHLPALAEHEVAAQLAAQHPGAALTRPGEAGPDTDPDRTETRPGIEPDVAGRSVGTTPPD